MSCDAVKVGSTPQETAGEQHYGLFVTMEILPGVHHTGNVSSETVWAGQSAPEVQIDGAEGSNGPIGTTTEDQVIHDGQTGGLRHL